MHWRNACVSLGLIAIMSAACNRAPAPIPTPTRLSELSVATLTPVAPTPSIAPNASTTPGRTATAAPASPTHISPLGPTTRGRAENFIEIGHHALDGRGWNAGLALAYPCAYVGNRRLAQAAIVDVSDPAQPALVGELPLAPGSQPVELRAAPDLNLLVILNFASELSVLTYDVSDCRHPQPLGALGLGAAPHEFFLWRDPARPARLLLYAAMFNEGGADLHVVDLRDPAQPQRIASWDADAEGAGGRLHSLSLSRDGRRAYLALWEGGFLVADTSELAAGLPEPRIRLVRDTAGAFAPATDLNAHSAVLLSDARYALVTQEVYACPFAGVLIADIENEARPEIVGRFALPENDPACDALPQDDAVFTPHNPLVVGDLAFITWYGGGLQALDVSDPARPARVGLFVPGGEGAAQVSYVGAYPVQLWSYPILREEVIYVSDIQSGLYVLRYTGPGSEALAQIPLAEGNVTVLP